jgi:hypothetical protein
MIKAFLLSILFCSFAASQNGLSVKDSKFYFEHTYGLQVLTHTEMIKDAKGPDYRAKAEHFQVPVSINVLYRNRFINTGIGSTVFSLGSKAQRLLESRIKSFYLFYDFYARLGFNFMAFSRKAKPDFRIGPFGTIGYVSQDYINSNCSFGLEVYIKNVRLSGSVGFYQFTKEEKEKQQLDVYYRTNNLATISIGWSLPNRFSKKE